MLTSIYLCLMLHNLCDNQVIATSHHHHHHHHHHDNVHHNNNVHQWNQLIKFDKSYPIDEDNQYENNSLSELQVYQSSSFSVSPNHFTNINYNENLTTGQVTHKLTNLNADNYNGYSMRTVKKHKHKQGNFSPTHRQRYHRHRRIPKDSDNQFFRVVPVDMTITEGDDVELECTVGNQKGSVQWSKDGFLLGFDPEIPGFPRYSMKVQQTLGIFNLRINNVQLEDEGDYQCQVGPALNNKPIRSGSKLTVMAGPKEVLILSSAPVLKGSSKTPHHNIHHSSSLPSPSSFTVSSTSTNSEDNSIQLKSDSNHFNNYPSLISSSETRKHHYTIYAKEAQRITLNCNTSSLTKPETKLTWFRNNIQLKQDSYTIVITDGLGPNGKLTLTRSILTLFVKLDDNGVQYTCKAIHPAIPRPLVNTMSISVLVPPGTPQIEGYTNGDQISALDTLTLACISRGGNPSPKLHWLKDNLTVDTSYSSSIDGKDSTNTYSFVVKPNDNNALVTCEAVNLISTKPLTATIKLTVLYAPTKIIISGPIEGKLGDKLNLECTIGPSNPVTDITWTVDGLPMKGTDSRVEIIKEGYKTMSNLTVTLTSSPNNYKTVTCFGHSKMLKETIFKSIQVQIIYQPGHPNIIGIKNGTNLVEDESVRLECLSTGGNPLATLKWYKGYGSDREISGLSTISSSGVSSILMIRAKPSDNGATYRCESSNRATSEPLVTLVTLNVTFMSSTIKITSIPKHPKHGSDVKLFCETGSCNPTCEVTWFINGVLMKHLTDEISDGQYSGKNTRSLLTIPVTDKHDQSIVVCKSYNKPMERTIEKNYQLRVLHKPKFFTPLFQKFDVTEENSFIINMTAIGFPIPLNYNWYKNGMSLLEELPDRLSSRGKVKNQESGIIKETNYPNDLKPDQFNERIIVDGPILRIPKVERYDGGEYECEASNNEGTTKSTIVLNVLFGATIVKTSETVLTELSGSASMVCEAIGNPSDEMTIDWYKGPAPGQPLTLTDSRITVDREKGRSILRFSDVQSTDEGYYICRASNGIKSPSMAKLKLSLKYKPLIVNRVPIVAIDEGADIVLTCSARGIPEVHFKWVDSINKDIGYTRETRYSPDSVYRYMVSRSRSEIDPELYESKLLIRKIRVEEFGSKLKCIALNERGSEFTEISLRPKSPPDLITNLTIVRVDHRSVSLSWLPGFNGGLPQFFKAKVWPIFGRDSDSTSTFYTKDHQSKSRLTEETNETMLTIGGLNSRQEYGVIIISTNSLGSSIESQSKSQLPQSTNYISFTTLSPDVSTNGSPLIDNSSSSSNGSPFDQAKLTLILVIITMGILIALINCALILFCVRHKSWKWLANNAIPDKNVTSNGVGQLGHITDGPGSLNKSSILGNSHTINSNNSNGIPGNQINQHLHQNNNNNHFVHLNGILKKPSTDDYHRNHIEPIVEPEMIPMGMTSHAQLLDNGTVIVKNVINSDCSHFHQPDCGPTLCDCNNYKSNDITY